MNRGKVERKKAVWETGAACDEGSQIARKKNIYGLTQTAIQKSQEKKKGENIM